MSIETVHPRGCWATAGVFFSVADLSEVGALLTRQALGHRANS